MAANIREVERRIEERLINKSSVLDLSNCNLIGNEKILEKLKKANSLQILNLSNNKISDISVLKELKSLQVLYLNNNLISDITDLKDLKKL